MNKNILITEIGGDSEMTNVGVISCVGNSSYVDYVSRAKIAIGEHFDLAQFFIDPIPDPFSEEFESTGKQRIKVRNESLEYELEFSETWIY